MALTPEQLERRNALRRYPTALANTRTNYLQLLVQPDMSEDEINSIWQVSFVLQYMIANQAKYIKLLDSLERDERTLAVLNMIFDQLETDPEENLLAFIEEMHQRMKSEEVMALLIDLRKNRNIKFILSFGGYIVSAVLFILGLILLTGSGAVLPLSLPLSIFLLVSLGITALVFAAFLADQTLKNNHCNHEAIVNEINNDEPPSYSLVNDYYSYTTEINDRIQQTNFTISHPPQPKTVLRQQFFQAHLDHESTLDEEVQEQFNLVPAA